MSLSYKIDKRGQKFNSLTIIDFVPRPGTTNAYWKCRCDCGNETIVSIAHLKTGHTKTCGKCKWTGKRFGKLTVLQETSKRTADGHKILRCKCDCGKIVEKGSDSLIKNKDIISCGCNTLSLGQTKVGSILDEHNIKYQREYVFNDLRDPDSKRKLRFDFAVFNDNNELQYLIEYDGRQHFNEYDKFSDFGKIQAHDRQKDQYCKNHSIKLIRIPYTDFNKITYDYIINLSESL